MHLFFSVGEPSGDVHGSNLAAALRKRDPGLRATGFGGRLMQREGVELLFPLAEHPVMGFSRVLKSLPHFIELLRQAEEFFDRDRPDAVVMIDYPGFNWHLARRAKQRGIPVVYYVPPQIWSWASWRVEKVRRYVDYVLCSLPFEEPWYKEHGVSNARYIGHPFFDDLASRTIDDAFVEAQRRRTDGRPVALLPGSRNSELRWNFPMMVRAAQELHRRVPETRFVVAGFKEAHRATLEEGLRGASLPVEVHIGRTQEILHFAEAAISVSGSVSLELMYHQVPTAVVYKVDPFCYFLAKCIFMKTRFITLVNLLADKLLFPEFLTWRDQSTAVAEAVVPWLTQPAARRALGAELADLRRRFGSPGATSAAAEVILEIARGASHARRAG